MRQVESWGVGAGAVAEKARLVELQLAAPDGWMVALGVKHSGAGLTWQQAKRNPAQWPGWLGGGALASVWCALREAQRASPRGLPTVELER